MGSVSENVLSKWSVGFGSKLQTSQWESQSQNWSEGSSRKISRVGLWPPYMQAHLLRCVHVHTTHAEGKSIIEQTGLTFRLLKNRSVTIVCICQCSNKTLSTVKIKVLFFHTNPIPLENYYSRQHQGPQVKKERIDLESQITLGVTNHTLIAKT